MVTTPENLVAGTVHFFIYWALTLMPVWMLWFLLQWAGRQLAL